jgi:CBS domain-containing protein
MVPCEHVFTCNEGASVSAALELMVNKNVSALVVLNEELVPVGILTKTDLVAAYQQNVPLDESVGKIMNREMTWLHEHDSRDDAARALERTHKHHALVKDHHGKWVGLISSWDIAAECAKDARAWPWNRHDPVKMYTATGYAH